MSLTSCSYLLLLLVVPKSLSGRPVLVEVYMYARRFMQLSIIDMSCFTIYN